MASERKRIAALLIIGSFFAGSAHAANCFGLTVTVDLSNGEVPTDGADVIRGTSGDDIINAGDGNDTVCGLGGNDTIDGGGGDDLIRGQTGNDTIDGGDGNDNIRGDAGNDSIHGGSGDDFILGNAGIDVIEGGSGTDFISGGAGDDLIRGQSGNDTIDGGDGNDNLRGDAGNDNIDGSLGDDFILGNAGIDFIEGGSGTDFISGGAGNDTLYANNSDLEEDTQTGDEDLLFGGGGDDDMYGSAGADVIIGNSGRDFLYGMGNIDDLRGGLGDDVLCGGTEDGFTAIDDDLNGGGDFDYCVDGVAGAKCESDVVDVSLTRFDSAACMLGPPDSPASIIINEFLTSNDTDSPLGNAGEDWIEIYNNESYAVSLGGWCLRDSGDEWCFPANEAASIPAFGYHVVIASGDGDESSDEIYFHTNFKLSKGGEFLGLYAPNEDVPVDSYAPYPEQETDQSYGKFGNAAGSIFLQPTPNEQNQELEILSDGLKFNVDALTLYGNDRLINLNADNAAGIPYTLEVSSDATWLSATTAPGEDGLLNSDDIALSVNTSGLSVGSYIGTIKAIASGFVDTTIEVNLLVPDSPSDVTDWETADVRFNGLSMPVDENGGRVFYSIGSAYSSEAPFTGLLTYNETAGFSVAFNNESPASSGSLISFSNISYASEMSVDLYENGNLLKRYELVLSNLPVVSMKAESITDEPDRPGTFQFVSGEDSESTAFYNMGVEYRGATSQSFPKKAYKIEFVDSPELDIADGLDVEFPGLRDDDDWILDASYRDTTFVRNLVSMDLWNDIQGYAYLDENGDLQGQAALKGGLVEVILNNEYYGVHVLQETLDRKLLDLTKGTESSIFKASTNNGTFENFNTARSDFEQDYPDYPETDNYGLLEDVIDLTLFSSDQQFIEGIGSLIDIDNAVDYWLFNVVTMAVDNVKKNYFIYRESNGVLQFTPWDFDASFGMLWTGAIYPNEEYWPDINDGVCLPSSAPNCNALFARLNSTSPEFNTKLIVRWNELKNSTYSVENLTDQFRPYLDQLTPIENDTSNAFIRNKDRWPDSGVNGRDTPEVGQIDWIEDWISRRHDFVDQRIN